MGNELILPGTFAEAFPTMADGIRRAWDVFSRIHSFKDIETELLKGAGLSPNTYSAYLEAVKQFYSFTEGLHPLSVRPCHIEAWYDEMIERGLSVATARVRVAGLKKFFASIRSVPGLAFYTSPFEVMDKKLADKLNRNGDRGGKLPGLSADEVKRLLGWLITDESEKGRQTHALVWFAVVTGLRAHEILQLTWGDIDVDLDTGKSYAVGTGKGGKDFRQEIGDEAALDAVRAAFWQQHRRQPKADEALFWTSAAYPGDTPRPLTYAALHQRITAVGRRAKAQGIIGRNVHITPHTLRRTAGKILDKAGASMVQIQHFLRHSNIETTGRYVDNTEPVAGFFAEALA